MIDTQINNQPLVLTIKTNKTMETKKEQQNRIIARGETTGHCHVITGNATITKNNDGIISVDTQDDNCAIKHLVETPFVQEGVEVWTKEHKDIPLKKGKQTIIIQHEYDAYEKIIRSVKD